MAIENLLPENKVHEQIYLHETYIQTFAPTLAELEFFISTLSIFPNVHFLNDEWKNSIHLC